VNTNSYSFGMPAWRRNWTQSYRLCGRTL